MSFNIPINTVDIIVLLVVLVLFCFGVKMLISFFKTPEVPKKKEDREEESNG